LFVGFSWLVTAAIARARPLFRNKRCEKALSEVDYFDAAEAHYAVVARAYRVLFGR